MSARPRSSRPRAFPTKERRERPSGERRSCRRRLYRRRSEKRARVEQQRAAQRERADIEFEVRVGVVQRHRMHGIRGVLRQDVVSPGRAMTASSAAVGTAPPDQLAPTFQSPPATLIQLMVLIAGVPFDPDGSTLHYGGGSRRQCFINEFVVRDRRRVSRRAEGSGPNPGHPGAPETSPGRAPSSPRCRPGSAPR